MKKVLLILMFVFIFILTGCEGPELSEKINSITINGSQKLYIGDEATYEAIFDPIDYHNQEVIWSSSDESKLTINQETGLAIALAETKEEGVFIYATSKAESNIKGSKKVFIYKPDYHDPVYPNLQGYTITIAQSEVNLSQIDPFLQGYKNLDKEALQKAWEEVEKDFNCKIEVKPYPSSAEWGPSRWNYIASQAENNQSEFDFCIVPSSKIKLLVNSKAIMSLDDFYVLYGNNMMDSISIQAGTYKNELYTFSKDKSNIYNVMYYNIGLLEKLQEVNPGLIEPAQIFLDGNWTHSKFLEYCEQVQQALASLYGAEGTAGSEKQKYFSVSGWDVFYWVGLSSNDGEPIVDVSNLTINIDAPHKEQAASIVKELYKNHYADPIQNIDQNVTSWNEGRSLFNTGDLWFVHSDNRWNSTLWGEDTRYGYVPWPRANDVEFKDIKVAAGDNDNIFVMPLGRNYEGYGEECNPENIYWALTEVYYRASKKQSSNNDNIQEPIIKYDASLYTDSEVSQKAYIYIQELLKENKKYYDPMVLPSYNIEPSDLNSYITPKISIKTSLHKYIFEECETWSEAISQLKPILIEKLR